MKIGTIILYRCIHNNYKFEEMLRNYLIVIWRSLLANRIFSLIHIFGLALGLACSILLLIIIEFETGYDRFHEKLDRIFILQPTLHTDNGSYQFEKSGVAFGPVMQKTFAEIELASRFRSPGELLLHIENPTGEAKTLFENSGAAVDSSFLNIFTFPLIEGDPASALTHKNSIVLTQKSAIKYFGSVNVVGRIIRVNNQFSFKVTGILDDLPERSHLTFDFLIPYSFLPDLGFEMQYFSGSRTLNFFLLHENTKVSAINNLLNEQSHNWYEPDIESDLKLNHFSRMHLHGDSQSIQFIRVFLIVALLILVIACINYMNLSTARFTARAREVGIRKALGASKIQLFWQFVGESVFMAFLALDIALLLIELVIPVFNTYTEVSVAAPYGNSLFIVSLMGLVLLTGLLSGVYPALILSSFNPVKVLKSPHFHGFRGFRMQKVLVVFQFTVTVAFVICAIFIGRQVKYMNRLDRGFREEGVIYFRAKGKLAENFEPFSNEVKALPGVDHVSTAHGIPKFISLGEFEWGITNEKQLTLAHVCWAGYDFPELFELEMMEGRFFDKQRPSELENGIVINRKLADFLELEEPIGQAFYLYHHRYTIIGIIENFDFFPLSMTNQGLIIPFEKVSNFIYISLQPGQQTQTLQQIESIYQQHNPSYPFEYQFLTDYEFSYEQGVNALIPVIWFLTFLGLFISFLGLLGLAAFSINQRIVEVGVRKSFGATTEEILRQFSWQFTKPVLLAIVLGIPVAWLVMHSLLGYFNQHIRMDVFTFALSATAVFTVAQLTIIWQTLKAARRKPADSLRWE